MGYWTNRNDSWRMGGDAWPSNEPRHWRATGEHGAAERVRDGVRDDAGHYYEPMPRSDPWPEREPRSRLGLGAEYQYPAGRDPAFDWGRLDERERSGWIPRRDVGKPRYPKGYRRPDTSILDDVCMMLGHDLEVDASEIEVDVQNAEVTLRGTVETRDEKRRAEQLAERVRGVVDVHNQLRARSSFLDRAVEKVKEAFSPDRHRA